MGTEGKKGRKVMSTPDVKLYLGRDAALNRSNLCRQDSVASFASTCRYIAGLDALNPVYKAGGDDNRFLESSAGTNLTHSSVIPVGCGFG